MLGHRIRGRSPIKFFERWKLQLMEANVVFADPNDPDPGIAVACQARHVPYPDGWYWHTDAGPFIGPFESIDDASEAAVIASDPGVEIKIFDTRGQIAKLPHDPPGGRVPKLANDPMRKVEVKLAFLKTAAMTACVVYPRDTPPPPELQPVE